MSDSKPQYEAPEAQKPGPNASTAGSAPKVKPRNPAFVAMGLPRLRLPSRNWMIFFSIVGTWTALVQYDRREKRIATEKWKRLVSDLKNDSLPVTALQRKLTIVIAAPPADGIIAAREHFHEYVKPVLEESGLDWDAIEGRREGEIRAGLAEKIRKIRQKMGEPTTHELEDWEILLDDIRGRSGVKSVDGVAGDIVIGRHTWKEYIRGLHEGWLGPMDLPAVPEEVQTPAIEAMSAGEMAPNPPSTQSTDTEDPLLLGKPDDDASPTSEPTSETSTSDTAEKPAEDEKTEEEKQKEEAQKKKRRQPPPYITTAEYPTATLSRNCPEMLGPSDPIPFPHMLGFFNFPIRIYRYLHKRRLAETIGRQTAAAILAEYRPYNSNSLDSSSSFAQDSGFVADSPSAPLDTPSSTDTTNEHSPTGLTGDEIKDQLLHEEKEWHKTIRKREGPPEQGREHTWTNELVLDRRIAERMRRFALSAEEEARASALDAQVRQEKWDKLLDIPARVLRGAASTVWGEAPGQRPVDTVGDASELD